MIETFSRKDIELLEYLIAYIKHKDYNINLFELKEAIISNLSNEESYIIYSKDENNLINGVLFGIENEKNSWLIQGFFFDSNVIAYELARFACDYIKPKSIIYKKFSKNNCHIWNDKKIEKYIKIIN